MLQWEKEGVVMKIQSKRVWIADQFIPAIIEFDEKIKVYCKTGDGLSGDSCG